MRQSSGALTVVQCIVLLFWGQSVWGTNFSMRFVVGLQDELLKLHAILSRREMFLLAKAFAEITGIIKTGSQGDFGKWQIGAGKQVFGCFNFVDQHVLTGRLSGEMAEDSIELALG